MRVVIVTSERSMSLRKVASTVGRVFEASGKLEPRYVYSPVADPELYGDVDAVLIVMTFDPIWAVPYFSLAWILQSDGMRVAFYTTVEGEPLIMPWNSWITRDLSFIANSGYTREKLAKVKAKVVDVVYHGIFTEDVAKAARMRSIVRRGLGVAEDEILVGYVAGGYARKGHREFAQVIRMVEQRRSDVKFCVVTQPNAVGHYTGLSSCIVLDEFGKKVDDWVYGFYHAVDVYAHPSMGEGFGLPVLEALAAGRPVVHADYAPLSEITDEKCSFRVPVAFVDKLREESGILYELHRYDPAEFAEAVLVAVDEVGRARDEYAARCMERARVFHARNTYNRLLDHIAR